MLVLSQLIKLNIYIEQYELINDIIMHIQLLDISFLETHSDRIKENI